MKRLHESNKHFGIEVALGKLKEQVSLLAHRGGDSHMNASLTRDTDNGLETRKRPSFADMWNKDKKTLVAVENNSSDPLARAKNSWQNFLFPLAYRLGVLLQGARFGNSTHESQSAQESWHVLGMKRDAERFADETSDTRPGPQVRPKAVMSRGVMQHTDELGEMRGFEFRLGSGSLGRFERIQTLLTIRLDPSKDGGSVESHGMSNVFDADSTLDHSYRRETHLFERLMADRVTVLPIGN